MQRLIGLMVCLVSLSGPAIADTCGAPGTGEYQLMFSDEFDGDSLDRNKWNTEFLWGPGVVINNEQQYYVNEGQFGYNPFKVGDGVLSIEAIKAPFDRGELYLTSSIYSATSAELLWRTPEGAVSYEIFRDGSFLGTASGGSYLEQNLRDGIDYAYEVRALDDQGELIVARQLTINTSDRPMFVEERPFSLELTTKIYSDTQAEVVWQSPNRAERYRIFRNNELYRELEGGDFSSIYEPELDSGVTYAYRLEAYDGCDELIIAADTVINTADGVAPPEAGVQRLVIAVVEYSKTTAELSWNSVAMATNYDIYDGNTFIANIDGRSLFVDDLVPGVDRRFRVEARDAAGTLVDETARVINTADNSFALNRQPNLSGIITSYDSFRFKYGRAEIRARMPAGKGLWSAFWLLNAYYKQDQPEDPEIDIIEAIGDRTTTANHAYHYQVDNNGDGFFRSRESNEGRATIDDFSQAFHVYSVEWSEGQIIWYVDNVETHRLEGSQVSSEQMYLIANLAVGGTFPGPADESTPFPAKFEIDYIRVYQRN